MEIKLSEVKTLLFEKLSPLANDYGLTPSLSKFAFVYKTKDFNAMLQFTYNKWYDEVQLMPGIKVAVKEIDNIWKKFDDYIGHTYWMNLRELEYWYEDMLWNEFIPDDKEKFKILNYDSDIVVCSTEVERLYKKYGHRYATDFANPKGVDFLYNANFKNEETTKHNAGFHVQGVVGLIAAKLANNPNFDEIVETYTRRIEIHKMNDTMTESHIKEFFSLKKYLCG